MPKEWAFYTKDTLREKTYVTSLAGLALLHRGVRISDTLRLCTCTERQNVHRT